MRLSVIAACVMAAFSAPSWAHGNASFADLAQSGTWYGEISTTVVNLRSGRPAPNRLDWSSHMIYSDGGGVAGSENYGGWAVPGTSGSWGYQALPGGSNYGLFANDMLYDLYLKPHSAVTFSFDAVAAARGNASAYIAFSAYTQRLDVSTDAFTNFDGGRLSAIGRPMSGSLVCSRGRLSVTMANLTDAVVGVGYEIKTSWSGMTPSRGH